MPELPEVETVVRALQQQIIGFKFWKVEILNPGTCWPSADFLQENLPGRVVEKVRRFGKFIIIELTGKMDLVVHLRMTGMLLFDKQHREKKFIRVAFTFSNAKKLYFSDVRKFGKIWLVKRSETAQVTGIARLGIDPFESQTFSQTHLEKIFASQKGKLKAKLLDQSLITGIGNIYADEICFAIGKHPEFPLPKLKKSDFSKLYQAIITCLREGIANGGTTIADFVGTKGDSGKHQLYLQVYGRKGDPCYVCQTKITKTRVAGRGTFVCLKCQKLS